MPQLVLAWRVTSFSVLTLSRPHTGVNRKIQEKRLRSQGFDFLPVYLRFTSNLCAVHGGLRWSAQRCEHNRPGEVDLHGMSAKHGGLSHISGSRSTSPGSRRKA